MGLSVAVKVGAAELIEGGGVFGSTESVSRSCDGKGECDGESCELHRERVVDCDRGACKDRRQKSNSF